MRFQELQLLSLLLLSLLLFFFNRIIAQAGHALQAIDVKQALPIKDIDA